MMQKVWLGLRARLSVNEMLVALFTANFIGICVARSLHYQFYSWSTNPVSAFAVILRCAILLGIELCWNTYPSTVLSSAMLHCLHIAILCILLRDYCAVGDTRRLKST
ncbi:unnamed protein product [Gongylonema pulchrum]|uniref:dolichyl-P-Man:Man5GlcNAc2-PP-dolichol alpha-1,3-mannosyltransferase n=1 Tax=Gongylonema pulchrum TaxID=637853 RepID=A0A183DCI7_9BILA|nr:unnamed protein product [Gongylonema pulchrum]